MAWKLFGPQATLFLPENVAAAEIATHFLSPNPEEQGTPRATWQHAHDGSAVWARAIQPSTDPNYVAPGAIPWLKLEKVGTARARPADRCWRKRRSSIASTRRAASRRPRVARTATQLGAIALVPYSTDYFFYRAEQ